VSAESSLLWRAQSCSLLWVDQRIGLGLVGNGSKIVVFSGMGWATGPYVHLAVGCVWMGRRKYTRSTDNYCRRAWMTLQYCYRLLRHKSSPNISYTDKAGLYKKILIKLIKSKENHTRVVCHKEQHKNSSGIRHILSHQHPRMNTDLILYRKQCTQFLFIHAKYIGSPP